MSEILLCALALALPIAAIWAYRRGLRAAKKPARDWRSLPASPDGERRRLLWEQQALLKKIDEYDGGVRR